MLGPFSFFEVLEMHVRISAYLLKSTMSPSMSLESQALDMLSMLS